MNKSLYFSKLAACVLAATIAGTTPYVFADETTTTTTAPKPGCTGGGTGMAGGYGMGPGMMGGYGMGPGMMGGYGMSNGLNLTEEQRTKINKIQDETRKAHWALMDAMMDQQARLRDLYSAPKQDNAAIDKTYKAFGKLQQQMYNTSVDAQKRMEAILTKEQQEKLHNYWRNGWTPDK
jgi:Spy/CpxP family protein refolding chaperone